MGAECYKGVLLSKSAIVSIIVLALLFSYAGLSSKLTKSLTPHGYNNVPVVHLDPLRGVEVDISPSYQSGEPGTVLTYTVKITNTGDVEDTYYSIVTDNLGWELAFGIKEVTILPSDWVLTTLKVTVPENALGSTQDSIMVTMITLDNSVSNNDSCTTQASIVKGVSVEISPAENLGFPSDEVTFFVLVRNTGNVYDNFSLNANDNSGWVLMLDNGIFESIPPGKDEQTLLRVTIPENATVGTKDNITVVSTSQADPTVSDNYSCIAHVIQPSRGVSVSISPSENNGQSEELVTFIVSVKNTGDAKDNIGLTVSDNSGWGPAVSPTSFFLLSGSSGNATLSVTIPSGAIGGTIDNIMVTATSKGDNTVSALDSCTAEVTIARGVIVSISPTSQSGANGATLTYTVTVNNTGNVSDTYNLTATDNAGWSPSVSPTPITVPQFNSGNATLSVTVPSNAIGGTIDNITVTATGTGVSASASCTAQVTIVRGVNVSISPSSQNGTNGAALTYTLMINNTGNVSDNYSLSAIDDAGWSPSVLPASRVVPAFSSDTATLSVTIPSSAIGGAIDNITVTAAGNVIGSGSCTAQVTIAKSVSVSISPTSQNGAQGGLLTYTVTVNNTGNIPDNYSLTVNDNASWGPTVFPTSLLVAAFSSYNATLSVAIPGSAPSGTEDNITVAAISHADNTIRDNASCIAHVGVVSPPTPPPPQPSPLPSPIDNTPPPAPSLISPNKGTNLTDNTPTLDWSDVNDPSGVTYSLSIARNSGFTSIFLLKNGLAISVYELTQLEALAVGTYYWRVRAVDNAGNASSWSDNWSFTLSSVPHPPPPTPATFSVSDLTINPTEVNLGEEVSISVTVKNTGSLVGTYTVTLKINGFVEYIENVTVTGGSTKTITFTVVKEVKGTYYVEVYGLAGTFTVFAPPIGLALPIVIILAIAIIAILAMIWKRRRKKRRGLKIG